jgi:biopolymer transport protein ExbD
VSSASYYETGERSTIRKESARSRLEKGSVGMLNIVPMLDILFMLLIFFLCFGLALAPEGALPAKLPASHGQAAGTMPLTPIEIHLSPVGGGVQVQVRPLGGQVTSMADLYDRMRALSESRDFGVDAPVIILPGADVPMAVVADAYNAAFQAGFKEIVFGEKTEDAGRADAQQR